MQCPSCGLMRFKKEWRPSQWKTYSPFTDQFKKCRVCDGEDRFHGSIPSPTALPLLGSPPPEALALLNIASMAIHRKFEDFFDRWMDQSAPVRKFLSYSGALRSAHGDPVHYTCPHTGENYFDPSNMIYSTALCFLAPGLMASRNWNQETRGDICEGLMGNYYELINNQRPDICNVLSSVRDVSLIIERTSWLTYQLYKINEIDFYNGCTRILDQASYLRQEKHEFNMAPRILPQPSAAGIDAPREKPGLQTRIS
jgi:hypothetical protein